jgi:hypothetical protein
MAARRLTRVLGTRRRASVPHREDDAVVRRLFDAEHYRRQLGRRVSDQLGHYLGEGWRAGLDPHPLFSTGFYLEENSDVAEAGVCPLVHYARNGGREGRRPHPLLDPGFYLDRYPDVGAAGLDPLVHFLDFGGPERRDPNPWFDTRFYASQVPALAAIDVNPLVHYATVGWKHGLRPHPDFDPTFYRETNIDLGDMEPLAHFLTVGWYARREPTPEYALRFLMRRPASRRTPCRLVVISTEGHSEAQPVDRCPIVGVRTRDEYEPRAGDYVYVPDEPDAALTGGQLATVALCLGDQCYDFVVVSGDRSNGSMATAASAANAVVVTADAFERWRSGFGLAAGSTGRFMPLPAEGSDSLTAIPLDRLGLGPLMRFDAELVVVGSGPTSRPMVPPRGRSA